MLRSVELSTQVKPQGRAGLLHPFPTRQIPHLDPFIFLDTAAPKQLGTGEIVVPPHPHRGVQPVSLLFRGRILHRDSLGNATEVTSGGMQWLLSGSGALHEERLRGDEQGIFHMAQLWINLPKQDKLRPPEHHALTDGQIPRIQSLAEGSEVRLYAGELAGMRGPAPMPSPLLLALVELQPGAQLDIPVPSTWRTAITVVGGSFEAPVAATGSLKQLAPGGTAVYGHDGDRIRLRSSAGGQALVMAGAPLNEPIAMGGGFVMNHDWEIEQAWQDFRNGRMGQLSHH